MLPMLYYRQTGPRKNQRKRSKERAAGPGEEPEAFGLTFRPSRGVGEVRRGLCSLPQSVRSVENFFAVVADVIDILGVARALLSSTVRNVAGLPTSVAPPVFVPQ